jgi:hypothetical protein
VNAAVYFLPISARKESIFYLLLYIIAVADKWLIASQSSKGLVVISRPDLCLIALL